MRHKIKILAAAGLAMMLTGVSVLAFSEVSVLMQAVSGKVAIRLEEFTVKGRLLERKSCGASGRQAVKDCQNFQSGGRMLYTGSGGVYR